MAGTHSPVKFGVSKIEMVMTHHPSFENPDVPSSGAPAQMLANSVDGSSGLPIARMRASSLVTRVSVPVQIESGMPQASSRTTRTNRSWMPWNPLSSWSAGLRPMATSSSSIFHCASRVIRPGRPALWALRI
jgi:hypothetical protein